MLPKWAKGYYGGAADFSVEEKPNILIIMTDEQAWDAVGYAGNSQIRTPNLDRLAREGTNFSHAVTPCPVCAPARTSILTGRLTEATKIRENRDVRLEDCFCYYPTFDEILSKWGYRRMAPIARYTTEQTALVRRYLEAVRTKKATWSGPTAVK